MFLGFFFKVVGEANKENTELLSKDIELQVILVGDFIFLSCMAYSGDGNAIIV